MNSVMVPKSILFVAANPKQTDALRLHEEEREIKEKLRLAGYGKVQINSTGATRTGDIQQALLDFNPQIVHFSSHGEGSQGLVFEDSVGIKKLVNSETLANLFKIFSKRGLECVVLNACYSKFQAEAIAQHIKFVIGMSDNIGDRAAIEFSVGFYRALSAGESIEFAYELGCNAIQLAGISEYLTPVLYKEGELISGDAENHAVVLTHDEPQPISPDGMEDRNREVIQLCEQAYPNESIRLIEWKIGEKQQLIALFREHRRGWFFQLILSQNKKGAWEQVQKVCPIFLPLLEPDEHLWEKLTRSAISEDWYAIDGIIRLGLKFPGSEIRLVGQYSIGENVADEAMEQFGIYVPDEDLLPALLFVNKGLGLLLISYLKHPDGFAKENMLCDDNTNECQVFGSLKEAQQNLERKFQCLI